MDENNQGQRQNKNRIFTAKSIIIIIILIAIAFGAWYTLIKGGSSFDVDTKLEDNTATVVAVVNNEEISRTDFDRLLTQQKSILGEPKDDAQQQQLQNQVLDIIISQTLVLQKAKELGMSITNDEINSQILQIQANFTDEQAFKDELVKQGLTDDDLNVSVRRDLLIQKYLTSQVDLESISVSDKEIKDEYDLAATKQDDLPDLETLSDPIKTQLIQQKQQQLVVQLIEGLKDKSTIEILLK